MQFFPRLLVLVGLFFSFQFYPCTLLAEESNLDSTAVMKMLDEAYMLELSHPDSAISIYKSAARIGKDIGYTLGEGRALQYTGIVLSDLGQYEAAIEFYHQAISVFETIDYQAGIASTYVNIGNIDKRRAAYSSAIENYLAGTRIFEEIGDTARAIYAYSNIGAVLSDVAQFDKSIEYNEKSLELSYLLGDSLSICDGLVNLGMIYVQQGKLDSAKVQYDKAFVIADAIEDAYILYLVYNSWCTIAMKERRLDDALDHARRSHELALLLQNPSLVSNAQAQLGQSFNQLQMTDSAYIYLTKAVKLARESNNTQTLTTSLGQLAEVEERKGNTNNALALWKEQKQLEVESNNLKQQKLIAGLELEYESEKKDMAIAEKNLEIERNEAVLAKRNYFIFGLIGLLILASAIFILVRKGLNQKKLIAEQQAAISHEQVEKLTREQELVSLTSMMEGEDQERARIAKDLHDGLGGMLSTVKLKFSELQKANPEITNGDSYHESINLLDELSSETRRISHDLLPVALEKFGLNEALADFCQKVKAGSNLDLDYQYLGPNERIDSKLEKNVYRIVQELVNNVLKHADAKELIVQLAQSDSELHITVEDNGKGFDVKNTSEGMGSSSIRSRVSFLKGNMEVDSRIGVGSTFTITIPINQA